MDHVCVFLKENADKQFIGALLYVIKSMLLYLSLPNIKTDTEIGPSPPPPQKKHTKNIEKTNISW